MLETIKHSPTLIETYTLNCDQNDTGPLKRILRYAHENLIDINVDNIRRKELKAIQQTLENFHKIHTIAVRSLHFTWPDKRKSEKVQHKRHDPCIHPDVLTDICRTLAISEISNQSLQMIEIQNLPITYDDVLILCKGLNKAKNLRFLSFENCLIGDGAVSDLCSTLKNCSQVVALNLSGCRIGDAGIRSIVDLLQYYVLQRQGEVWKDSLRYQTPNLDAMGALRRLTLNNNNRIGNHGSKLLCEVLRDDHWMKAIDLQNCGLGDTAGQAWLDLLKGPGIGEKVPKSEKGESREHYGNRTLGIVDLRNNKNLDRDLLRAVTERVLKNAYGKQIEFKWLQARNKTVSDGQVTDWPGMEGIVRKDLDIPTLPQRVSTTNPGYQPKSLPVSKQIHRPNFKPAGGPLTRTRSLPRISKPQHSLRRNKLRRTRSASFLSQNSSKQASQRSSTSAKISGDEKSQSNLVSVDNTSENSVIPGVPWRTAARAKGKSLSKADKGATVKVPQILINTLNERKLINGKRTTMIDRSMSSSVTSRRNSLRLSAKGSSRRVKTASSSPRSLQMRSNRTSPEGRLRRQLQKHMVQNTENANCPDHNDYALQDLYNRLNGTLAQVEQVVKKIKDSKKSGIKKPESDQLILIQSTLRELITPMRHQLDPKNINQAPLKKSSKTSSRSSYSSLRRGKEKTSSSSKKVESTGSMQTAVEKSQTYLKQNSLAIADGSVKSSDNSSTIKDKNHSNITSLEEFFLAKPGHAFHFPQQSSAETSSAAYNAQSLPIATFSISPMAVKRMARSAPSLVKPRSTGKSEILAKCVDLFEDVGTSEDVDDIEFTAQTKSISTKNHGTALEAETLFSDF